MIVSTRDAGLDVVMLDRPHKRNALTVPLWRDLTATIKRLGRLRQAAPVLLRGAGGYFCAGADLEALAAARASGEAAREFADTVVEAILTVHDSPRPVVAVVEAGAAGGGVELTLACHARVAIGPVQLIFPFGRHGVVPDRFTTWRLAQLVGAETAQHLVTGDHRISGEEAMDIGLLDAIAVDRDEAFAMAVDLAGSPAPATRWPGLAGEESVTAAASPMVASLLANSSSASGRSWPTRVEDGP